MPTRVYLVDDSPDVLTHLEGVLHRDTSRFEVVGTSTSGTQALKTLQTLDVDVVLLDLSMPRLNGVEVLEALRPRRPDLPVVVITAYVDAAWILPALRAGASGYVLKTASAGEILAAIDSAIAGSFPTSVEVLDELATSLPAARPRESITLGPLERELLADLADGLTNSEIAHKRFVSVGTVKQTIASLSQKLAARNRTHLVSQAARLGMVTLRVPHS